MSANRLGVIAVLGATLVTLACSVPGTAAGDPWFTSQPLVPYPVSLRKTVVPVAKDVAAVTLHVSKKDATVVVDGEIVGQAESFRRSGNALCLTPGTHQLELRKAGYQTLQTTLVVEGGQRYDLRFSLHREPR